MSTSAFDKSLAVEAEGLRVLTPYLERLAIPGTVLVPTEGHWMLQKLVGDFILRDGEVTKTIEVKVEERHTGNLFLETWSNRSRHTPGWMYTCRSMFLWYYFIDQATLYTMPMRSLRNWAFGSGDSAGGIYAYPERKTSCDQMNDTWGRVVPVARLIASCQGFLGPINPGHDAIINEALRNQLTRRIHA
jgi:hypothetical protein